MKLGALLDNLLLYGNEHGPVHGPTPRGVFHDMAEDIVATHDLTDEVSECGYACHWHEVYGWVPEADCPVHDAPESV